MGLLPEIMAAAILLASAIITVWMAGAIYFDVGQGRKWARWLTGGWVVGVIALFATWQPLWQPLAVLLGIAAPFIGWWLSQKASHKRDWDPSVAVLPRAERNGDVITIENVRNFEYRSRNDFDQRYETRTVDLSNLRAADIIFFTWGSEWMNHPVLVFDFGPDGRICISIEVRYRKGQKYSFLRSLYRQQELIYLFADERDIILRRTKHGTNEGAYLYQFRASIERLRTAFLDYIGAINRLYDTPQWYHGLCANCTTTFYRLPGSRVRWDWRVIANGRLDRALYEDGRLDRTVPFKELQRSAYLNEIANSAPAEGFGDHIRRELERRRNVR